MSGSNTSVGATCVFPAEQITVTVQCGNMTVPPSQPGYRDAWKVTKEWKITIPSSITAEGFTDLVSKEYGKRLWPHELSVMFEKPLVLRQGPEALATLGVKDGTVIRFWNGKYEL